MKEFLFSWINTPSLLMTPLQKFTMWVEFIFTFFTIVIICSLWDVKIKRDRQAAFRKKHGNHCTCLVCMGVI